MYKDDIIAEVWNNRDAYARKHNNNLDEIIADLRKREQAHPDRVIDLLHRRKPCTTKQ